MARNGRAFSLVELLATVAIVSLLIGLLAPALAGAKKTALRTACAANLRSVHQLVTLYADDSADQAPLGYRGGRAQWNTMVHSGANGGSRFVLFGRLYVAGLLESPGALYCPAERAEDQSLDTPSNPWPPGTAGVNVQGGYASAPFVDWGFAEFPKSMVRLTSLAPFSVLLADGVGLPERVASRHADGVNTLRLDGASAWAGLEGFSGLLETCVEISPACNGAQAAIWEGLGAVLE